MPFQFSELEKKKLQTAWLAYKDIESQEFIDNFRNLWDSMFAEVEVLIAKCSYDCNLREVGKVGLTLRPNTSFNFSFIDKAYMLNVWSFFFSTFGKDLSAFFRPPFLLANELVHEYAHFRFWREHGMFERDLNERIRLHYEQRTAGEKYAHKEEEGFLKKLRFSVPILSEVKLFRVNAWKDNGLPECEGTLATLSARRQIKKDFEEVRDNRRTLENLFAIEDYNTNMSSEKAKHNIALASILKLNNLNEQSQIVWMNL